MGYAQSLKMGQTDIMYLLCEAKVQEHSINFEVFLPKINNQSLKIRKQQS